MNTKKLAVFISGRGSNFKTILDHQKKIGADISLVISHREAEGFSYAKEEGIDTLVSEDYDEILEELEKRDVEGILLLGFLKIIPKSLVEAYPNKIINIHPSLIPAFAGPGYYGMKVHEEVISRGVRFTGCTTHFVDEIADNGPIILQRVVSVDPEDDVSSITSKVLKEEHEMIVETVELFCQNKLKVKDHKVVIES